MIFIALIVLGFVGLIIIAGLIYVITSERRATVHSDPHLHQNKSNFLTPEQLNNLPSSVAEALQKGKKIEAIKRYRAETGVGLKEAKEVIEGVQNPVKAPATLPPESLKQEVVEMLQANRKIGAIKLYREQTGMGLKEAKEAVEEIQEQFGL